MARGKTTKKEALKALRKMDSRKSADAIIIVRGRLDQEGSWDVDWEGAHWMPQLDEAFICPSGLPAGFGMAAAKEIGSVTAEDTAEDSLGRMGAALGRGLMNSVGSEILDHLKGK